MTRERDHALTELKSVMERRAAWIRAAMERETCTAAGRESPFVMDVIERSRKLQFEIAADRYFGRIASAHH